MMLPGRTRFASLPVLLLAAVPFATCKNDPADPAATAPSSVQIAAGNNQEGPAGEELGLPLAVVVFDATGGTLAGVALTWSVEAGGGSVQPATINTASDGSAMASWTLGETEGEQRVHASVEGIEPAVFTATALPASQPVSEGHRKPDAKDEDV